MTIPIHLNSHYADIIVLPYFYFYSSDEMRRLSVQEKNKIGLKFEAESEFWMTMDDFIYNFTDVELCRFFNTSLFSLKKKWNETLIVG